MATESDPVAEVLIELYDALADAKGKVHKGKILGILDTLAHQERDDQKMLSILEVLQARPSLDNQSIARLTADELAKDRPPQVVQMPTTKASPWWLLVAVLTLAFVAGMATAYALVDWHLPQVVPPKQTPAKKGK